MCRMATRTTRFTSRPRRDGRTSFARRSLGRPRARDIRELRAGRRAVPSPAWSCPRESIANIALSTVPEAQSGVASGVNDTFRQVGIAAGTAALGAAFLARAQTRITELLPSVGGAGAARGLANGVTLGGLQRDVSAQAVAAARQGFYASLDELFITCAVVSAIGAVLALVLVRGQDMLHHDAEADIPAAA